MRLYALTELHDPEAIELFISEEDAKRALEDCLRDEPDWRGLLRLEEIELSGADLSPNWTRMTRADRSRTGAARPPTHP
jgi:hypothetical protein